MGRLRAALTLAAAAAIAGCNSTNSTLVPPPTAQPIQHVIIMMQENRSFNNVFAGFPHAKTAMSGACEPGHSMGMKWCQTGTAALTPVTLETTDRLGLGTDIDHSHHGFEIECNANASNVCQNNGFSKIEFGEGGGGAPAMLYPYAYIKRSETKAYWDFAKRYSLADEMFFTETASSFISHQMILSGTVRINSRESLTDQPDGFPWGCDASPGTHTPVLFKDGRESQYGPFPCFTEYGTIADLLDPAKVSWTYYVDTYAQDFSGGVWNGYDAIAKVRCKTWSPPYACNGFGADWAHMSSPNTSFFKDVKNGTLPAVSWVIPTLEDSDHPASGCNHGPHWVTSVINAVGQSKYWKSTAIVLVWDDWGGWYDPEPPAQINYTSLGFRVGMVVVSPWARPNTVVHTQYDFGSILKFVEQSFGLGSLHTTDASANSMLDMFDFTQKPAAYVPEPLPPTRNCTGHASPREIIEHDGGVPE
ncbi:MAG: alkaline phosphatase family protein [Candidatus Cybelea sp.]